MGLPLKQIDKKHGPFDFALRSHSSANSRLSYTIFDDPETPVDDIKYYIDNFTDSVRAIRTTYAIPFASNQCHLHPDVVKFNTMARTPFMVKEHFEKKKIDTPDLKIMISGDSWDSETGFDIKANDFFTNRDYHLKKYIEESQEKLDTQAKVEARSKIRFSVIETYYQKLFKAIPWLIRRKFKGNPIVYVLSAGGSVKGYIRVDPYNQTVTQLESITDKEYPAQIHVATFIFMMCIRMNLFSHLSISKRVLFYTAKDSKKHIQRLNTLYNYYEYDMLPLNRLFQFRFFETWVLRWREIILYACLLRDKVFFGEFRFKRYLKSL